MKTQLLFNYDHLVKRLKKMNICPFWKAKLKKKLKEKLKLTVLILTLRILLKWIKNKNKKIYILQELDPNCWIMLSCHAGQIIISNETYTLHLIWSKMIHAWQLIVIWPWVTFMMIDLLHTDPLKCKANKLSLFIQI